MESSWKYQELARCFGRSTLENLLFNGESNRLSNVIEMGIIDNAIKDCSLSDLFQLLYEFLLSNYRCEYVFKNIIATNILLKNHSLNSSALVSEIRSGSSRADIVIFNGTSNVYEIKTDIDSYERLPDQISSYRKMFDKIYVVTSENEKEKASDIVDTDIGLISLDGDGSLKTNREAKSNCSNVDPGHIFKTFRKKEYQRAAEIISGEVPDVPNALMYSQCKEIFTNLPSDEAHELMTELLSQRGQGKEAQELLESVPNSLNMATLHFDFLTFERDLFEEVLSEPALSFLNFNSTP